MSTRKRNTQQNKKPLIFISWSGSHSKKIAEELKRALENDIFTGKVDCFVSTQDIASGEDWYKKIRSKLSAANLGIVCITKENVKAPWLYFEAGALVCNNLKVIPLLINCDRNSLEHTPISKNQSVQFYEEDNFKKMLSEIQKSLKLLADLGEAELNQRFETGYANMRSNLGPVLADLKGKRYFSERYIYPQDVTTITMDTVYISAPMATLTTEEYIAQREFLENLSRVLIEKRGFKQVYCPAIQVEPGEWEGITTAVKDNYRELRQVQHLIVLYPGAIPTSAMVEIGYGIALCKNTVIFYKDKLPFMLNGAAEDIPHLHTRKYATQNDILKAVKSDRSLFEVAKDE